jgi:hypothetical protein
MARARNLRQRGNTRCQEVQESERRDDVATISVLLAGVKPRAMMVTKGQAATRQRINGGQGLRPSLGVTSKDSISESGLTQISRKRFTVAF